MYSFPTSIPRMSTASSLAAAGDLPDTFELYARGAALDSVRSFRRKVLPVADLDNELKALGMHGVAGSGTSPF